MTLPVLSGDTLVTTKLEGGGGGEGNGMSPGEGGEDGAVSPEEGGERGIGTGGGGGAEGRNIYVTAVL
jgi:hypothetical protein